jgi:hypothetical protein
MLDPSTASPAGTGIVERDPSRLPGGPTSSGVQDNAPTRVGWAYRPTGDLAPITDRQVPAGQPGRIPTQQVIDSRDVRARIFSGRMARCPQFPVKQHKAA